MRNIITSVRDSTRRSIKKCSTQSTVSPIIDCRTNSQGSLKEFFTILGQKKKQDKNYCVYEIRARIHVFSLARAPQRQA